MKPKYIIIHHSLTKDSGTLSWGAIRRYHLGHNWNDIGYHYGIEMIQDSYEILVGRVEDIAGAHCKGMNSKSIGICCVGNFDDKPMPYEQERKLLTLCRSLVDRYRIPIDNVLGHREVTNFDRTCPGRMFNMEVFRGRLLNCLIDFQR